MLLYYQTFRKTERRITMDKRYMNLNEMYRDVSMNNFHSGRVVSNSQVNSPTCINTDYCTPTPRDKNNGILTMVFIDMQPLESVYSPEAALCNGTLFPNINKPFMGGMRR